MLEHVLAEIQAGANATVLLGELVRMVAHLNAKLDEYIASEERPMANFKLNDLTKNDDAIVKAIASVDRRAKSLRMDVQTILVAICGRWVDTGDVRPALNQINTLMSADGITAMRSQAIGRWVEAHMGFTYETEGDDKGKFVNKGKGKPDHLVMKTIINNRWWEFTPAPAYKPLDLAAQLAGLISKADKRIGDGVKEGDNVDEALLEALKNAQKAATEAKLPF